MPTTLERVFGINGATNCQLYMGIEADSQTYKFGDLVTVPVGTGKVTIIATAGNSFDTDTDIYGIVLRDGRNTTGHTANDVPVLPLTGGTRFLIPIYHTTAASAILANAIIGKQFAGKNVGGICVLDLENTTKPCFTVVDKLPGQSASESFLPVVVGVVQAGRQLP